MTLDQKISELTTLKNNVKTDDAKEVLDSAIAALRVIDSIIRSEKDFEENLPVTEVGATNALTFAREANENRGFKNGALYINWLSARSKTLNNLEATCHSIANKKKIDS